MNVLTPKTPTRMASRDDRLRIHTLYYDADWTVADILLSHPQLTQRQVYYALNHRPTPQKHLSGRHILLDTLHRKYLVEWVSQSSFTRDVPWVELPKWLEWNCRGYAIRAAFKKEGYTRALRRMKPPISLAN